MAQDGGFHVFKALRAVNELPQGMHEAHLRLDQLENRLLGHEAHLRELTAAVGEVTAAVGEVTAAVGEVAAAVREVAAAVEALRPELGEIRPELGEIRPQLEEIHRLVQVRLDTEHETLAMIGRLLQAADARLAALEAPALDPRPGG